MSIISLVFIFSNAFALSDSAEDNVVRENTPIFHLYDDLDLISSQKIMYGRPKVVVKAIYPRLESDVSRAYIDNFNEIISNLIKDEASEFERNVKDAYKNLTTIPKTGTNNLYIDYNSSAIQSGRYHLLSVRMSIQGMINGMAHPYHYYRVINYNLDTGDTITLADLFREDADYLGVLASYARKTLMRRLDNKEMIEQGTSPTAANYKIWNIKPTGILITFEDNQVAPYVFGAQTVLVPYSVLKSLFTSKNPITKCMRRQRCSYRHLLTGGFIEEARVDVIDQTPYIMQKNAGCETGLDENLREKAQHTLKYVSIFPVNFRSKMSRDSVFRPEPDLLRVDSLHRSFNPILSKS